LSLFLQAVGYGIVAPTLPALTRSVGVNPERFGFLFGLYALVGFFAVIPLGYAADRWGRKFLLDLGLTTLMLASVGILFAVNYPWLVVARGAQGLGGTAIWVACLSMWGDLPRSTSTGRHIAWMAGAWSLGFLLGPAIGELGTRPLLSALYPALCLLTLILSYRSVRETHHSPVNLSISRLARVAATPEVQASSLVTFSLAFFYGAFYAFMPWLLESMGFTRLGVAALLSTLALPSALLPRLVGHEADSRGDRSILAIGLPMHGLLAIFFLDFIYQFPLWIGFLALGLTEVVVYIPAVTMLQRVVQNRDRGAATAIHILSFSAGFVIGPLVSGRAMEAVGHDGLFRMMGFIMIFALVGINAIFTFRRSRLAPHSQSPVFPEGGLDSEFRSLSDK
jgi:predicted MFS family arabinose efflux permease